MTGNYDLTLLLLSLLVMLGTVLMALRLSGHLAAQQDIPGVWWLVGGGFALGGSLWSAHFIFLLAYRLPIPVGHNILISSAAVATSTLIFFLALRLVSRQKLSLTRLLPVGGLLGSLGLCALRYADFAAMQVSPPIQYTPSLVLASWAAYALATLLFLWFMRRHYLVFLATLQQMRPLYSLVLALAIALILMAAQYLAIRSIQLAPNAYSSAQSSQANEIWMAVSILDPELFTSMTEQVALTWNSSMAAAVAACAFLLLGATLLVSLFDTELAARTARLAENRRSLRKTLAELELILKNASVGICTVIPGSNGQRFIGRSNRAMEEILGYAPRELNGRNTRTLYPNREAYETFNQVLSNMATPLGLYQGEHVLLHRDGHSLLINMKGSAIDRDDLSRGSIWLLEDITERKRMEVELVLSKEQAEAAARTKSEFLANMSHEIRTPMNAVIGLTRLLMDTALDKRQMDYLQKIFGASRALLGILNDILDYSKVESGHLGLESVDFILEETLDSITSLFGAHAEEKGIELFIEIDSEVPARLHGDPLRLGQILNNLVGNAVKFTDRGEVHIRVEALQQLGTEFLLRFSVRDTGIGISKEQLERLFRPFSQADGSVTRKYGGTGLGLSISKHIVELMGGEIAVESQPGIGSNFHFNIRIPAAASPSEEVNLLELPALRVLVVDDKETSRQILRQILESWRFTVHEAASGEAALLALANSVIDNTAYDLLLLDWQMPVMDGLELAARIQHDCADGALKKMPMIIMVTAFSREKIRESLGKVALDAVLTKPVTPSHLLNTITRIHRGETTASRLQSEGISNLFWQKAEPIRGARVLLAEDNPVNQQVAREFLEKAGLLVDIACNGCQALEKAESVPYDIILMDLHMPEMDGLEAARRIRASGQTEPPILAMTAAVMQEDKEAALQAGMLAHIAKPIDPDELIDTLLRWIKPGKRDYPLQPPSTSVLPGTARAKIELPGFALEPLYRLLGDKPEEIHRVLFLFAREFADAERQLESLLAEGDFVQARQLVHSIKGAAGNLGAFDLHTAAARFEEDLKQAQDTTHSAFATTLKATLATIGTLDPFASPLPEALAHDAKRLNQCLARIETFLNNHELLPEDILPELHALLPEPIASSLFQTLQQEIDRFDYISARASLEQIVSALTMPRA